jgi:uncharacterized protein YdeI (YjbR/CyaY-like superfamily)
MKPTFFTSQRAFRKWLAENHAGVKELWVGFYRRDSGKGGIAYAKAVDEGLCFGWIDGLRKAVDGSSYRVRFTPRKQGSTWSSINTRRVHELIRTRRMRKCGLAVFEGRDLERSQRYSYERYSCRLDSAQEKRFKARPKAWAFFHAQAAWYQRTATWWVVSAKREETRLKRLATLIADSEEGRKIGLLDYPRKKEGRQS